jgi:hypothetical protein
MAKIKPPKWVDVYPYGTKAGDEEHSVFVVLARNPKFDWRSLAQIVKETGLSAERVEEILFKYHKKGMVFQRETDAGHWAYWERVPHLLPDDTSLVKKDQNQRVDDCCDCEQNDSCSQCSG